MALRVFLTAPRTLMEPQALWSYLQIILLMKLEAKIDDESSLEDDHGSTMQWNESEEVGHAHVSAYVLY